jgi:hypothetical protein
MICEPKVCLAQTVHLHYPQMDQNELPVEPQNLGVPSGVSKMISEPKVCLVQTVHLSCTDTHAVSKLIEMRFIGPTSPRGTIGCVQNDI